MKKLKNLIFATATLAGIMFSNSKVQAQTPKLNDAEIASVAVTANQIDVHYAELALKKSKDVKVREFATTMKNDHNGVIKSAVALATKLKVTPKDNAVSQSLNKQAGATEKMLNGKTGKAFDKAYVDNEVAYHKAVIDAVEKVLIPQTQNPELKKLLEGVLPVLKTHLAHAEMLQKQFK
ncbi:MAG TPA: DUF4142 domain-containing protein [Edaphocola sp.]|nr:DUF4142 domain-containing protein [Edaphocola sp.]